MKQNNLDRILMSDKEIEPSASFAANMMSRIQAEEPPPSPIPFPWFRFALTVPIVAILTVLFFPSETVPHALNTFFLNIGQWIVAPGDPALRTALLSAFASLTGTLLLVWISLRLAGDER